MLIGSRTIVNRSNLAHNGPPAKPTSPISPQNITQAFITAKSVRFNCFQREKALLLCKGITKSSDLTLRTRTRYPGIRHKPIASPVPGKRPLRINDMGASRMHGKRCAYWLWTCYTTWHHSHDKACTKRSVTLTMYFYAFFTQLDLPPWHTCCIMALDS